MSSKMFDDLEGLRYCIKQEEDLLKKAENKVGIHKDIICSLKNIEKSIIERTGAKNEIK